MYIGLGDSECDYRDLIITIVNTITSALYVMYSIVRSIAGFQLGGVGYLPPWLWLAPCENFNSCV